MTRLIRYFCLCAMLLLLVAPSRLSAQSPEVESIGRGIHFEGFTRATHLSTSGMNLWVEISNNTRHRIVIKEAELEVHIGGRTATTISLRDKVVVRRGEGREVLLPLRFRSRGAFTLNSIVNRIAANDTEDMTISYRIRGGTMLLKRTFSEQNIAMSEFFNNFAVEDSDATYVTSLIAQLQEIINNN